MKKRHVMTHLFISSGVIILHADTDISWVRAPRRMTWKAQITHFTQRRKSCTGAHTRTHTLTHPYSSVGVRVGISLASVSSHPCVAFVWSAESSSGQQSPVGD